MTYDTVASICQVVSLLLFVGIFLLVLAYALRPANGARFEVVQRRALNLDPARPEKTTP
jgi:cbb3-type cytochrome oxidase subunit 3